MMYQVLLSKDAIESLRTFDTIIKGMILSWIEKHLASNAYPRSIGENFGGEEHIWRYRIGKYRVLSIIDDKAKTITIVSIVKGYQSKSYAIPPIKRQVHDDIHRGI